MSVHLTTTSLRNTSQSELRSTTSTAHSTSLVSSAWKAAGIALLFLTGRHVEANESSKESLKIHPVKLSFDPSHLHWEDGSFHYHTLKPG